MNGARTDVIVIGAGASGLEAARRLSKSGAKVIVVEARSRIGGRIFTVRDSMQPVPIELGAEFVHGKPRETWDLIRDARLAAYEVGETQRQVPPPDADFQDSFEAESGILARLDRISGDDLTFADFLKRHAGDAPASAKALVTAYVEGFYAADRHVVSAHWLRQTEKEVGVVGGQSSFRIQPGHEALALALLAGSDKRNMTLRLNAVVSAVRWRRGSVIVDLSMPDGEASDSIEASSAIVTVPLGVLQAAPHEPGAIRFMPELAEKRQALSLLRMGAVVKVVLSFCEPFWEDKFADVAFVHAPQEFFPTWWTTLPMRSAVLTGWAGGPRVERLAHQSREELPASALDCVARVFNIDRERLDSLLVGSHMCDWQADPFSRGAYSYVAVYGTKAPQELAAPLADTLFFAGEATHPTWGGTVAGAIASGCRAADELLHRK